MASQVTAIPFWKLFCLFLGVGIVSCTVTQFALILDGSNGGDGSDFTVTLFWDDYKYSCTFRPINDADGTVLTCNNHIPITIPSGRYTRFYAKFEYAGSTAIQFRTLLVIDHHGNHYTMNRFCISSGMECTFINHGFTASVTQCEQFNEKNIYPALALGGTTKFTLLYTDFRFGAEDFPNQIFEGSVRPPLITQIGLEIDIDSSNPTSLHTMSAQWDTTLYACSMVPNEAIYCVPDTNPSICPGGLPSAFWVSIYNPALDFGAVLSLDAVFVMDETGSKYYMREICLEPGTLATNIYGSATDCSQYAGYKRVHSMIGTDYLAVGGFTTWWTALGYYTNTAALIAPQCLFDYPDNISPPMEVQTLNGGNLIPDGLYGWGPGLYGNANIECPPTSAPTSAPSNSPTFSPSSAPTLTPTNSPTLAPTYSPTLTPSNAPTIPPTNAPSNDPTLAPTNNPTSDPTYVPTSDPTMHPTSDPIIDPTPNPTRDPTQDPTNNPTSGPTSDPTRDPTQDPTMHPTSDPTKDPTLKPTLRPSLKPTNNPTKDPTLKPTLKPSLKPTNNPTTYKTNNLSIYTANNPTTNNIVVIIHDRRQQSHDASYSYYELLWYLPIPFAIIICIIQIVLLCCWCRWRHSNKADNDDYDGSEIAKKLSFHITKQMPPILYEDDDDDDDEEDDDEDDDECMYDGTVTSPRLPQ